MIAVTFALPAESSAFVRRLRNVRRNSVMLSGDLPHQTSNIKHQTSTICVVHTGVGASKCRKRLGVFLKQPELENSKSNWRAELCDAGLAGARPSRQPRLLISSGFCGGTSDQVSPGDLIIALNYSEAELVEKARAILPQVTAGKIFSADEVIDPAKDRYGIGRKHGAMAIDMETETIARLCAAKNIPMLGLRVVTDSPAAPFPAPPHVLFDVQTQRTKFSKLFAHLAREPAAAVRLARFSKQIAAARETLAEALCAIIPAL